MKEIKRTSEKGLKTSMKIVVCGILWTGNLITDFRKQLIS